MELHNKIEHTPMKIVRVEDLVPVMIGADETESLSTKDREEGNLVQVNSIHRYQVWRELRERLGREVMGDSPLDWNGIGVLRKKIGSKNQVTFSDTIPDASCILSQKQLNNAAGEDYYPLRELAHPRRGPPRARSTVTPRAPLCAPPEVEVEMEDTEPLEI